MATRRPRPADPLLEEPQVDLGDTLPLAPAAPRRKLPRPYGAAQAYVLTGSTPALQTLQTNLPHPGRWSDDAFWAEANLSRGSSVKGRGELRPVAVDGDLPPEEREAWASVVRLQRDQLSAHDADVLDALLILWRERQTDYRDSVRIRVDDVLGLRSLRRNPSAGRRGGYKDSQRRAVRESIFRLQSLFLKLEEVDLLETDPETKRQRRVRRPLVGRAFVVWDVDAQLALDGSLVLIGDVVHFQPHPDLARSLVGPDQQLALLPRQTLARRTDNQGPEKNLSRTIHFLYRNRAHKETYLEPVRVVVLLRESGIPLPEDFDHPGDDPERIRRRFEDAMNRLEEDGEVRWQYADSESYAANRNQARRWFRAWTELEVILEPPDYPRDWYRANLQKPSPRAAEATPTRTAMRAEALRELRAQRSQSQMMAAEEAGVSQKSFSRAESGAPVSQAIARKLDAWLASAAGLTRDE